MIDWLKEERSSQGTQSSDGSKDGGVAVEKKGFLQKTVFCLPPVT